MHWATKPQIPPEYSQSQGDTEHQWAPQIPCRERENTSPKSQNHLSEEEQSPLPNSQGAIFHISLLYNFLTQHLTPRSIIKFIQDPPVAKAASSTHPGPRHPVTERYPNISAVQNRMLNTPESLSHWILPLP